MHICVNSFITYVNQSIGDSVHHAFIQSILQSLYHSIDRSIDQSTNQLRSVALCGLCKFNVLTDLSIVIQFLEFNSKNCFIMTVMWAYNFRYVVGWDAQILFRLLWNLPEWLADFFVTLPMPTPEGVKTKWGRNQVLSTAVLAFVILSYSDTSLLWKDTDHFFLYHTHWWLDT